MRKSLIIHDVKLSSNGNYYSYNEIIFHRNKKLSTNNTKVFILLFYLTLTGDIMMSFEMRTVSVQYFHFLSEMCSISQTKFELTTEI